MKLTKSVKTIKNGDTLKAKHSVSNKGFDKTAVWDTGIDKTAVLKHLKRPKGSNQKKPGEPPRGADPGLVHDVRVVGTRVMGWWCTRVMGWVHQ